MHLFKKSLICSLLILIFTFSLSIPVFANTMAETMANAHRLAGQDRYETAAAIARGGWTQSNYAILAFGRNFPDALSAAPLSKKYDAPILLSERATLTPQTKQALIDLKVKHVIIIGGTGVISQNIDTTLVSMGINPTRIAGNDRYETSIKIAQQLGPVTSVAVVSGDGFADGLSIGAIAAKLNMPVILMPGGTIPANVSAYLATQNIKNSYVIGGTSVVSDSVMRQLPNAQRLSGDDRYATNIAVLDKFDSNFGSKQICIAAGSGFADALAGSGYAAKTNSPIVLVGNSLSSSTRNYLTSNVSGKTVNILGGEAAVSSSMFNENTLLKLGYTNEKYALVFGSVDNDVYQSASEAQANMVNISINVWQINASGVKCAAQRTLTVHKAVAGRVRTVFKEIFEGQDKFPIYSVSGYSWRGDGISEHNWGLAIDINPKENYMITSGGVIVAGSLWNPGNNPYSIPEEGKVVTTFNKYGFAWGGNAWKSSHDYMHFSYLGR
ncbi:MAG TPA: cell wall-binding repeat-containing protein [Desulfosporosinus sp.]|nr:cell wall-binding repeat-containing protein [Desulfosporosinus sp.]